jgi:hypothetical protein
MSKEFLFNPKNPKKSFDVYIDKNPNDTIPMKYSNINEVKDYIKRLEKIYKKGEKPHSRISKNAMILRVRLRVINEKNPLIGGNRLKLITRYTDFLKKRTAEKNEIMRKRMVFKI